MKNQNKIVVFLFLAVMAVSVVSLALVLRQPKVGVVDNQKLMVHFSEAIEARAAFDRQTAEWTANLKQIQDSIKATVDVMSVRYEKSSKVEQVQMRTKLDRLNQDFQRYGRSVQQMRDDKLKELLQPVGEKMDEFLKLWAQRKGYDMLVGTGYQGGVILYASSAINVTNDILVDLEKEYPNKPAVSRTDSLAPPQVKMGPLPTP